MFPSATHNRFAHSLGAYHLAGRLLGALEEAHPGRIDPQDGELVQLAALLHDVGHPPFSHLLETPEVFATFRHHESWGREMLTSETTEVGAAVRNVLGTARFERLLALLDGAQEHDGVPIPRVLKEIVSSQLDVDRMDYLVRDQANTGAQIGGFDIDRVMRALRIAPEGEASRQAMGLARHRSLPCDPVPHVPAGVFPQGQHAHADLFGADAVKGAKPRSRVTWPFHLR